jgi:simple sugar transport system permease protein
MKWLKNNLVPIAMLILGLVSFKYAAVSVNFLASEVFTRFIRNMLFVLALILPVTCGMGINFAIIVGAISAQMAIVFALDLNLTGLPVMLFVIVLSILLAALFGALVAWLLNKARGNEMIVSIMIGQISSVLYQFVFMVVYGLMIQPKNKDILLASGVGVRSMLDAGNISNAFKQILPFTMDGKVYSALPLIIIALFTLLLIYLQHSKLGILAKAVGSDLRNSTLIGINSDRIRAICIIISTVFAAMSQVLTVADYGTIQVYTGHVGIDTYAAAAILVGGASIKEAKLRNCFIGVLLFHTLFITSPMAGQNLFNNPSVGEYFRSFLAYGIIVIAIIMNLKNEKDRKLEDFKA